jgi:diguanylate cyclase (GGDEF)-like protein/PAS domain S-box-containing protein
MLSPVEIAPGVLLDGRTLIIAIAAAFGGWRTALVALLMVTPVRVLLGGVGIVSEIGMMFTAAAIGIFFHQKSREHLYSLRRLFLLGALVGCERLVWLLILPQNLIVASPLQIIAPVMVIYPIGTVLLGALLSQTLREFRTDEKLRINDLAFRTSLSGVIVTDRHGNITTINPAAVEMFGYDSPDELKGRPYTDLLVAQDKWGQEYDGDTVQYTFGYMGQLTSGRTFPVNVSVAPIKDERRQFLGFVLTINDLTERKQKEDLLAEATRKLAQSSANLKQLHHLNTIEYTDMNDMFNQYLRVGSQILNMSTSIISQVEGNTFRICAVHSDIPDFVPGMELDLADTYCIVVVNSKNTTSYDCVGKMPEMQNHPVYLNYHFESYICAPLFIQNRLYGTMSFFATSPREPKFEANEFEALELMAASISHMLTRYAAEEALRESEERYRSVVNVMSNGIILQHADGSIRASNKSAEEILGLTTDQMQSITSLDPRWQSVHEDGSPFPGENHPSMVTLRTGEPQRNVTMGVHKPNGALTWISINSQPMFYAGETKPYAVVTSFEDITHRKQIEMKLNQQVQELQTLHQQVAYQAEHDALTKLFNRQAFERRFSQTIERHKQIAMLYVDLDRFKIVNDTFGHEVGDLFLCTVANRLQQSVSQQGMVARFGGDEFVAILPDFGADAEIEKVAQHILETLSQPFIIQNQEFTASASIGVSFYPQDGHDIHTLLRKADSALYTSKVQGRNTYQLYRSENHQGETRQLSLEHSLRHALDNHELDLYYQPQVELKDDRVVGVEALIRWQSTHFGRVSPADFIPIAEQSGLIVSIGAWVLEQACRQCKAWHDQGHGGLRVAVNISAVQFRRDDFVTSVQQILTRVDLPAQFLELELTESILLDTGSQTLDKLNTLKQLGVHLAIDDFGTGYSSLSYLQNLPIDKLKIDRSFIQHIDGQHVSSGEVITKSIINLAHNLGMEVIAEGIETEVQKLFIKQLGCEMMQGYLFSPPLPANDIENLLEISIA